MSFPRPAVVTRGDVRRLDAVRRRVLQAMALAAVGGVSGFISRALAMGAAPVKPGIHRITGPVTVNGGSARVGMAVRPGDTVETGPSGEVIYVIGADAFLQRGGSRVIFGAGAAAPFFRILTGKLLSVFGKGARRLEIPAATIGIRGTGCYIDAAPRRSYFCLCYGVVELKTEKERALEYETTHHENPLWIEDGVTSRAPVIDHTDEELVMLEQLVGRWPPFYGQSDKPVY